jgi:hypothetical protein
MSSNPEAKLKASVARDIKIRLMDEHAKKQSVCLSIARWDNSLPIKDRQADKKRLDASCLVDSQLNKTSSNAARKERLEALYRQDAIKYDDELSMRGLAFRRERV